MNEKGPISLRWKLGVTEFDELFDELKCSASLKEFFLSLPDVLLFQKGVNAHPRVFGEAFE